MEPKRDDKSPQRVIHNAERDNNVTSNTKQFGDSTLPSKNGLDH